MSMVVQLPKNTLLFDLSRAIINEIICSPINSDSGIKLSLDKPLNNEIDLNVLRPAVLRQYFGKEIRNVNGKAKRYTYGSGSGTSSVGMDPHNFVTRALNSKMIAMIDDINDMLHSNNEVFKMTGVDIDQKFNHCTILIYYAGEGLKEYTKLGYHTDCVYSPSTGEYETKSNSQKVNTPAVIYSIGDKRRLNWKCRNVAKLKCGRNTWQKKKCSKMRFELGTDTLTIIHPDDEYPLSSKNVDDMKQYLHGGVNVSGQRFSIGFVFRVVNHTAIYHNNDDTMVIDTSNLESDIVNGVLGFDIGTFHINLINI